jgi:hypothetical protein
MNLECIEGEHTPTSGERREDCTKSRVFPDLVVDDYGAQEMLSFACIGK